LTIAAMLLTCLVAPNCCPHNGNALKATAKTKISLL
jgi:hypothetical protein